MSGFRDAAARGLLFSFGAIGSLVALDYGGVTNWSQYVGGLVIFVLALPALALGASDRRVGWGGRFAFVLPIVFWAGYSALQSSSAAPNWVERLTPGTYSAFSHWHASLFSSDTNTDTMPLSIAPDRSWFRAASLLLLLPLGTAIGFLLRDRRHVVTVLTALSLGAVMHAAVGLLKPVSVDLFGLADASSFGHGFGSYVNRNNAALMLNLGIGCALGLCIFRFHSLRYRNQSRWDGMVSLLTDRVGLLSVITVVVCTLGLLVGGSRGGLVSMAAGYVASFLVAAKGKDLSSKAAVLCYGGIAVVITLLFFSPLLSEFETMRRLGVNENTSNSVAFSQNNRLAHWPDGFRAALQYLPLGSGAGTYSYAYLPFQQSGSDATFQHADNLWLEILVEQGLIGILIVTWLSLVLSRSIIRLVRSSELIDRGLVAASLFVVGFLATSQTFDFGLLIPGNAVSAYAFFCVVVVRSHSLDLAADKARINVYPSVVFAGGLLALGALGLVRTHDAVQFDWVSIEAKKTLQTAPADRGQIQQRLDAIDTVASSSPTAEAFDLSAKLANHIARLETAESMERRANVDIATAFEDAKNSRQRVRWRDNADQFPTPSEMYLAAVNRSKSSLDLAPLGIVSRGRLVELDFVYQDRDRSRVAVDQLRRLQSRSPSQLERIAKLAFVGDEIALAAKCWRQATAISPSQARQAIDFLVLNPSLEVVEFLDESPDCYFVASQRLMTSDAASAEQRQQRSDFYQAALAVLDEAGFPERKSRSRCCYLRAEMLVHLSQFADAWECFQKAITIDPANSNLVYAAINRMLEHGGITQAKKLALEAVDRFPDEGRFGQLLRKINQRSNLGNDSRDGQ